MNPIPGWRRHRDAERMLQTRGHEPNFEREIGFLERGDTSIIILNRAEFVVLIVSSPICVRVAYPECNFAFSRRRMWDGQLWGRAPPLVHRFTFHLRRPSPKAQGVLRQDRGQPLGAVDDVIRDESGLM